MNGYISVRDAARLAGVDVRLMRQRLQILHEEHSNILFRFSGAPNAKLWTTPQALKAHMPERFAEVTALDLLEFRQHLIAVEKRVARVEKRVFAG